MFNYIGCSDFVLDRLMNEANERLHSNKLKIISENLKIKHSEDLLNQFKQNLVEKNENLNLFIEEENRLEKEIENHQARKVNSCKKRTSLKRKISDILLNGENVIDEVPSKVSNMEIISEGINLRIKSSEVIDNREKIMNKTASKVSNVEIISEGINLRIKSSEVIDNGEKVVDKTPSKVSNVEIIPEGINLKINTKKVITPITFESSGDEVAKKSALPKLQMLLERLELQNLRGVNVTTFIWRFDFGTFIGGSNGFLMRYAKNNEHVYNTKVKENIIQIEITVVDSRPTMIAFTNKHIVIFEVLRSHTPTKIIYLPGIRAIFNDNTLFYISLYDGSAMVVKRFPWRLEDFRQNDYSREGIFFPCTANSKYSLISLKDKFLYRTRNKDLSNLEIIEGVEDVRKCLKVNGIGYLLTSLNVIYFLNKNFKLNGSVSFVNTIKILQCSFNHGVVVDCENILHVYILLRESNFGDKILEKQIEGEVTAIVVSNNKIVYLVIDNVMHTFNL